MQYSKFFCKDCNMTLRNIVGEIIVRIPVNLAIKIHNGEVEVTPTGVTGSVKESGIETKRCPICNGQNISALLYCIFCSKQVAEIEFGEKLAGSFVWCPDILWYICDKCVNERCNSCSGRFYCSHSNKGE